MHVLHRAWPCHATWAACAGRVFLGCSPKRDMLRGGWLTAHLASRVKSPLQLHGVPRKYVAGNRSVGPSRHALSLGGKRRRRRTPRQQRRRRRCKRGSPQPDELSPERGKVSRSGVTWSARVEAESAMISGPGAHVDPGPRGSLPIDAGTRENARGHVNFSPRKWRPSAAL